MKTVVSLWRRQVEATPDQLAIVYQNSRYTYQEADRISECLAVRIKAAGLGRDQVVSILIGRNQWMALAPLGVAKAGCAYQPLDPAYPQERLRYMINDAKAKLLIADEELLPLLGDITIPVILTKEIIYKETGRQGDKETGVWESGRQETGVWESGRQETGVGSPEAEDLLMLVYTSGTTGQPKGVMQEQRNVASACVAFAKYLGMTVGSRVANYASFGFVPTVVETWGALSAGATLHILDNAERFDVERLKDYIRQERITHLFMTTMMAYQFAGSMDDDTTLQVLSCGGEKLPPLTPPKHIRMVNFYGSSECTSIAAHDITEREEQPTLGTPLGETTLAVIAANGQPAAPGEEGELWVMGPQVSRGYLNAPELTAQKYDMDSIHGRIFKTGDIVMRRNDGALVFVGRRDGMVKIRGFRIELKEVEGILLEYPGVKNATVKAFDHPSGGQFLTGYVVSDQPIDAEDVKCFVASKKPDYMVPEFIMQLEKIPVNQNQKVDKRALPHPQEQLAQGTAPQNPLQQELHTMVAEIVKTTSFGIETPLRLVGLTSITAIRLASRLLKTYGVDVDAKAIVKDATILSLEENIRRHGDKERLRVGDRRSGMTRRQGDRERLRVLAGASEQVRAGDRRSGMTRRQFASAPLSYAQTGIYVDCVMNPESVAYNIPVYMRMAKGITAQEVRLALQAVIDLHPMMKVHFETQGEDTMQVTDPNQPLNITETTMTNDELTAYIACFVKPFDLQNGPLYRAEIVTTADGVTLLLDVHHLIFDGTSVDIFFRQLCRQLEGQAIEPEMLPYLQYAQEQKEVDKREAKAFFDQRMARFEGATEIPTDHNHPKTGQACCHIQPLDWQRIEPFCREQGITPCHLLLAATIYTASRYSNNRQISLCTISSGRADLRTADTTGMFVNTLPVCEEIGEGSVADFLHKVSDHFEQSLRHEQYPFATIAADYDFHPQLSFVYQVGLFSRYEVRGEQLTFQKIDSHMPKFKLQVMVFEDGAHLNYDDAAYELSTIQGFGSSLAAVVDHFIEQPERAIRQISIVSGEQKVQLSGVRKQGDKERLRVGDRRSGMTGRQGVRETTFQLFHECISHYAKTQPDREALVACDATFTYQEMDEATNRIAAALRERGVRERDMVALLLPRTSRLILSLFGVLKTGAAYIPCDPEYPADRVKYILEDSEARYIITTKDRLDTVPADKAIDVETLLDSAICCDAIATNCTPDDLAYLIYTSGSTGRPKGVMLRHEGICNFLTSHPANVEAYAVSHTAKTVLAVTTISFDASMHEIGVSLFNGLTLVLANEEQSKNPVMMAQLIKEHHIGYVSATPSQWQTWIYSTDFVEAIRQVPIIRFGGEQLPEALLHQMQQLTPSRILNTYGPTETTVSSNICELTHAQTVTVGKPQLNVIEFVVDCDGNELPVGVVGELYIGGRGVGRGYHHLEEMTRQRFVNYLGRRIYRSGDYAKWLPNGEVVILGRTDHQIKLRGLRIELGEIEHAIASYPDVQQVRVVVRPVAGTEHLCAYFTAGSTIDVNTLKTDISTKLTEYMVPTIYMQLEKMPMTPNGKIDQKALPEPEAPTGDVAEEQHVPMNKLERALHELAADIMQNDRFGLTTPLRQAGLTSLTAIRLAVIIQQRYGVMLQTKELIKSGTLQTIEDEIVSQLLANKETGRQEDRESGAHAVKTEAPLSSAQTGVYMDCMKQPGSMAYNTPFLMSLPASVTLERLTAALTAIIKAHPQFNIHFEIRSTDIMQVMDTSMEPQVTVTTMTEEELKEYRQQFMRPFNLNKGPLYRFEIVQTTEGLYLLGDIHHLIFDGSSRDIFNRQLVEALDGKDIAAETYTLLDYATDEQAQDLTEAKAFFDDMLKGCEGASDVPNDRRQGVRETTLKWVHQPTDLKAAEAFCQQNDLTPASLYLAAVLYATARYTSNKEAYICTISSGRSNLRISQTMGMFVNTLPLSATIGTESTADFLRQTAERFAQTLEYEQYPFAQIAADYGFKPSVCFAWQVGIRSEHVIDGVALKTEPLELKTPKFKIDISVEDYEGTPTVTIGYDDACYTEAFMQSLAEAIDSCVTHFMAAPEAPVAKVSLLNGERQAEVMAMSKGKELKVDLTKTFANVFTENARRTPDALAVADDERQLTYAEMEHRANILAHHLIEAGVTDDSFVALMLERTVDFPVAVLAVHKAGAAYLPLDLEYPAERLQYMLENSEAPVLLTTHDIKEIGRQGDKETRGQESGVRKIFLDDIDFNVPAEHIDRSWPDGLAYMIYTSGSTGKPKGAMLHQAGLKNFIAAVTDFTHLTAADRVSHHRSFSFDAHIEDLFPILSLGGSLHIMPSAIRKDLQAIYDFLVRHKVTGGGYATPMAILLLNNFDLPIRFITAGGDKLAGVKSDHIDIINVYGPTECTDDTSFFVMERGRDYENIPIGKSIANCWSFIADNDGNLLPQGVAGELCFAGVQVGRGYWRLPERTAQAFGPCPYVENDDFGRKVMMYHTGDLCRYNAEGNMEFIGRIDSQVKINGFRIELGEIESVARQMTAISEVAAAVKDIGIAKHICLYYTVKDGDTIDREVLQEHMEASGLASYMVPDIYVPLTDMPHTPSGKINTKALPAPDLSALSEYVAPRNETEEKLCAIFSEVLKLEKTGIKDDFFTLGGTSLQVTRVVIEASRQGFNITYGDIFRLKTVEALARYLMGDAAEEDETAVRNRQVTDFDYTAIDNLLQRNTLFTSHFSLFTSPSPLGNVLLTGATGFLGIHVLRELINLTPERVSSITCLIRAKDQEKAKSRLQTMLYYYFADKFGELFADRRLSVVIGDVTQDLTEIVNCKSIDTVFNCAANVKHFSKGTDIEDVNLGGARQCIKFCLARKARLIHVSTMSTRGIIFKETGKQGDKETGVGIFNEQKLFLGQYLVSKYAWSKFMAEREILQAVCEQGLQAKIMRVGNLSARSTDGEFQVNFNSNTFMGRLRIYQMLRACPYSQFDMPIEFSPVDQTAQAIVLLATTPDECCLFHPYNHHQELLGDVLNRMSEIGQEMQLVEDEEYEHRMEMVQQTEEGAKRLSGLVAYLNTTHGRQSVVPAIQNAYTMQVLYRMGFRWDITTWDYIDRMLQVVNGMGFFDDEKKTAII